MKRFFSVCITIICLSIFWLTSCQNPVAGEEVEKASETEQSGVKDSEKTSETEQIYLNNSEIIWKGDLESAPENPEKNWIYYNTTDCNTYIWNAETKVWDILASEDWWQRGFINCNANEHGLSIGFNTWLMGRNGDNNNCTLYVTDNINGFQMIKSFSCNNQSWIGFNYPLTKKGEEYDVTIIVEGTIELRIQDRFKGIAQGGIGYPILKNKDNLQPQYNNKTKVISYNEEPQFDLSNFDGDLLDIGIFYAIYANKAWQDWLIQSTLWKSEYSDYTSHDLHDTNIYAGWREFEFLDAKLKGTTIFSDNSIRVKVSGCDPKNTYINYGGNNLGPIEYESGSKKNKVLVVYQANVPKEVRMNVKNLPGKKITTVVNPDDSNNYYDIYGEIYDFGEEFYEPTKNPTVDGYKFVEWNMDFNKKSIIEPPMYERGDSEVEWYKGWCLLFEGNGLLSEKDEAAILSVFEGDKPTDYNNLYIYEIEAKFEKEFDSVNFYSDENQVFKTVKSEGVFQGCNIISIPTEKPTKEGFEFLGWNTEENFLKFNNRFYYSGEWIDYQTEHDIDYQEVSVYHFQNGKALIRENKSNDVYFIAVWKPIAAEIVATGRMH